MLGVSLLTSASKRPPGTARRVFPGRAAMYTSDASALSGRAEGPLRPLQFPD